MTWKTVATIVSIGIILLMTAAAFGQARAGQFVCAAADKVTAAFVSQGMKIAVDLKLNTGDEKIPLRIFANPKTGRWVLVTLASDGLACLIMVGDGYSPGRLLGGEI